ncbi:MAG: alkanesulfonate monooxygenase SsuD, partial [Paraglaciecola sp.]
TIAIMDKYKKAYQQSSHNGSPQTMITVAALCAPTKEEALYLAASQAYWKVMAFRHGIRHPWVSPEEALNKVKQLSISDQSYYQSLINSITLGSPQECAIQLEQISEYWKTNEVGLVTVTHDFGSRKRSFELLAKALLV